MVNIYRINVTYTYEVKAGSTKSAIMKFNKGEYKQINKNISKPKYVKLSLLS